MYYRPIVLENFLSVGEILFHDKNINRTFLQDFQNGARGHKICTFCTSGLPRVSKSVNLCPRVPYSKRSVKESYLIVLSGCSFLSLTNFFPCKKATFFVQKQVLSWCSFLTLTNFFTMQKSNFFVKKHVCLFYDLFFYAKFCPANFFHCKKSEWTFFHAKKVFFNKKFNRLG